MASSSHYVVCNEFRKYSLCNKKRNMVFWETLENFDLIFWIDDNRQETDFCTVFPSLFDCHTKKISSR